MPKETNGDSRGRGTRRSNTKIVKIAAVAIIVFVVLVSGAGLGFLTASIHTMPSLNGDIRPAASSQIFDVNGKLIATIHSVENRVPVSINKVPKELQEAFIAAEDVRFYQHIAFRRLSQCLYPGVDELYAGSKP